MSYVHDDECRCQRCTQTYCAWCSRPKPLGEDHPRCGAEQRALHYDRLRELEYWKPIWDAEARVRMGEAP